MGWIAASCASALFAGLVSILSKLGVRTTDPDVATAVRTSVVAVAAWCIAALSGSLPSIPDISPATWLFLALSGLATGGSWICYFKALSQGDVNKVAPIDKSSAALAALLAIVLFGETSHLGLKLVCITAILIGTLLMIKRTDIGERLGTASWPVYAVLAALFAALTSILGKIGIDGIDSNLGTAVRTCVVLAVAWTIVAWKGKSPQIALINRNELGFLALSGLATAGSWLCYYYAIQTGVVSTVVQIDKLSVLVSVLFASIVLKERLAKRAGFGLALMVLGTAAMTACS